MLVGVLVFVTVTVAVGVGVIFVFVGVGVDVSVGVGVGVTPGQAFPIHRLTNVAVTSKNNWYKLSFIQVFAGVVLETRIEPLAPLQSV